MFGLFLFASLAIAQEACPTGQVRSDFTQGHCCWPGQAWSSAACVGIPACPEGMKTLPDRCEPTSTVKKKKSSRREEKRNVVFAGGEYSGQVLYIDGIEAGRLPNAFMVTIGEHVWTVKNSLEQVLIAGEVKIRVGKGDQIVMVKSPD